MRVCSVRAQRDYKYRWRGKRVSSADVKTVKRVKSCEFSEEVFIVKTHACTPYSAAFLHSVIQFSEKKKKKILLRFVYIVIRVSYARVSVFFSRPTNTYVPERGNKTIFFFRRIFENLFENRTLNYRIHEYVYLLCIYCFIIMSNKTRGLVIS